MEHADFDSTAALQKNISGADHLRRYPRAVARRSLFRSIGRAAAVMILALCGSGRTVRAAEGDLDPTFGRQGKVRTDFNGTTDIAYAIALQPDGKMVVAGTTYANNDYSDEDFAITR
jgi:hypothetical protein